MTEEEILETLEDKGLALDEGDRIDGPFIPDGTVRIYDPECPVIVCAEGSTVAEAFENLEEKETL